MKTIATLLSQKDTHIWCISDSETVYDAIKLMAEKSIGSLLVTEGEELVGIITERDYARKVILANRASKSTLVSEIMTSRLVCVTPKHTIEECMALMTDKRVRHLPILDDGKLVAVVSIGDLVKAIIAEQQFIIEQLEHYINN